MSIIAGYLCWNCYYSYIIADLLKIKALPRGTLIVSIRDDTFNHVVIEGHLFIPAGTVAQLVEGIHMDEKTPEYCAFKIRSTKFGRPMARFWSKHFSNADFKLECDQTGRHVYIFCSID